VESKKHKRRKFQSRTEDARGRSPCWRRKGHSAVPARSTSDIARSELLYLVHHNPNRRKSIATLVRPAHALKRSIRAVSAVLDGCALCDRRMLALTLLDHIDFLRRSYLRPSPITPLNNLSDRPSFRVILARKDVLNNHGGREHRSDVKDLEVAAESTRVSEWTRAFREGRKLLQGLPLMLILPQLRRLVENVQLSVLRRKHIIHPCAELRRFVGV
jgi:hypothetical protein